MADEVTASVGIREFSGRETCWERCDDEVSERFRFNITADVTIWVRPGYILQRSAAVAALRTLAGEASQLADVIEGAEEEAQGDEPDAGT